MGNKKLDIPPEFTTATNEQQVEFVQDLWDQIASNPQSVPVPAHHYQVLNERLEALRTNPQAGLVWSEVREQLLQGIGREPHKDSTGREGRS